VTKVAAATVGDKCSNNQPMVVTKTARATCVDESSTINWW